MNGKLDQRDINAYKDIEGELRKYKTDADISKKIYELAREGKKNGKLNNDMLENFRRKVLPTLDTAQRQKLNGIIDRLKTM